MNYNLEKTANVVRKLRCNKGITQEVAAKNMGINVKTYRSKEKGYRGAGVDTLCDIATYYAVSLDYLLTGAAGKTELDKLTNGLTEEQLGQLIEINSSIIQTLGWKKCHNVG